MPNQTRIINAVNMCLKQHSDLEFELNKSGVCAGLAGLYIKYALENKTTQFFSIINRLSTLPTIYRLGGDAELDEFIIKIEKTFRPNEYSGFQLEQGDLDKILHIGDKPLRNEFNFGFMSKEQQWEKILGQITRNNRAYYICSQDHAVALSIKNGKYSLYDPNYTQETKEFSSAKEVINELKNCFGYKTSFFALLLRTFANPHSSVVEYPPHETLQQLAETTEPDIHSGKFAAQAKDIKTLSYLVKKDPTHWQFFTKEFLFAEVNDLLLQQPKSSEIRQALLKSIAVNTLIGNSDVIQKLITHYQSVYSAPEEQDELTCELKKILATPVKEASHFLKKTGHYQWFLNLCDQLSISQDPTCITNYNHVKLLTFLEEKTEQTVIEHFLNQLSPPQILKQIQCAAAANQQEVLTLLINKNLDTQVTHSIFTPEVIKLINVATLKRLLENGFATNINFPNIILSCMQRKDKTIFELMTRSWSKQNHQQNIWQHIDKHEFHALDLTTKIDSVYLISALVFLRKTELVKKAWREDISEDIIQNALMVALQDGNVEMSKFLHEKLLAIKSSLEQDVLDYFYTDALAKENIETLIILMHLNFNILHKDKDIDKILSLCDANDDYSIVFASFQQASPKVKLHLLTSSLRQGLTSVVEYCAQKEPQLFNTYLNECTKNKRKIAKLNQVVTLLPPNTLRLASEEKQKALVINCFNHKLFPLAKTLTAKLKWEDKELNKLLIDLIKTKNEGAIIQLIQIYPQLKKAANLIQELLGNNLLNALDSLLTKETILTQELSEKILAMAIVNNNKKLINRFFEQGQISKLTPQLMPLLEQAITQGASDALEPFIQSPLDLGLDFKALFLFSCAQKQAKIANQLLVKELILSTEEIKSSIKKLFDKQNPNDLFEVIYQQGYGRLYQLFIKSGIKNPRKKLLSSIKNPQHDAKFKQTTLYLSPLKRAIKEKNQAVFDALFAETDLPLQVDANILTFLQDLVIAPSVLPIFIKKYTLTTLLQEALKQEKWAVVANLIENYQFSELDTESQNLIHQNSEQVIMAYLTNLEAHFDKTDVRPRLFQLLATGNTNTLSQLATAWRTNVHGALTRIELVMIEKRMDLNNQIYRYVLDTDSFSNALTEVGNLFNQCNELISTQKIDLKKWIENKDLLDHIAKIKVLMAQHDISPLYISDEHCELLEQFIENPRLKKICEQELQLYSLIQQFDLKNKGLEVQHEEKQEQFTLLLQKLGQELIKEKLPTTFIVPEIQSHLASTDLSTLQQKCTQAIDHYLQHRDETLSYLSYFFDYKRGKVRAEHYEYLIQSAQTPEEIYIIEYALLTNRNSKQIKKDVVQGLNFSDEHAAKEQLKKTIKKSRLVKYLTELDHIIERINNKVDSNDATPTATLLHDEIASLRKICKQRSPLEQHSFFNKPQEQPLKPTGVWQWLTSWINSNDERSKLASP